MSYTLAELELSEGAYEEIKQKFIEANYQHAFLKNGIIDMNGIGISKKERRANKRKHKKIRNKK